LCANLSTPLFKEKTTQIEEVTNKDDIIEDMDPNTCITTIMQESLERAVEISRLYGARVSSLNDADRKKYMFKKPNNHIELKFHTYASKIYTYN
jgi:hypothetical protein